MTDVPEDVLKSAREIGKELKVTLAAAAAPENSGKEFMDLAPASFRKRLADRDVAKLQTDLASYYAETESDDRLLGGAFLCGLCTTGLYFSIAAAIGGAIILSGGMSIPAVLAASGYSMAGLATVISAVTGVSVGAVTAMLTGAGTTLALVVLGLCEAMGSC